MSRFKVGDKVRVRKDLVGNELYGDVIFANEMCEFKGRETTINKEIINKETDCLVGYALEGMTSYGHYYLFTDEMLEPVEKVKVGKGDLVEITNGKLKGVKGKVVTIDKEEIKIGRNPYILNARCQLKLKNNDVIINGRMVNTLTIDLDNIKLISKAKKEGVLSIVSFEEKCKYILQGDKTTVVLPSGIKGQVKLYKGDKYNKDLGIKLAYHKAKFNEAIKEIENN